MGKFSVESMRHLESEHWRVLTAVEMGMKNHEFVSLQLVSSLAQVYRGLTAKLLGDLQKTGVVSHERGPKYDGYRLTTLGYDYLALHALRQREVVGSVGNQIGVGKESDVYVGGDPDLNDLVLKFHRLGRTSFRKLKEKRDYHGKRHFCSWLYLSRIAALKEFTFLRALYSRKFPVPEPLDCCRHTLVMSLVDGFPLASFTTLADPAALYDELMSIIVRLARHGLIHGDFNEFNLILTQDEKPVLIDFPQMVSTEHPNAEYYFNRDVECVRTFFRRRFDFDGIEYPKLADIERAHNLDVELEASGFTKKMSVDLLQAYDQGRFNAHEQISDDEEEEADEEDEQAEENEDTDHVDEDQANAAATPPTLSMTAVRRALGDVDAPANAENNHDADKDGECDVERTSVRGKVSPPLSICSVSTSIAPKEVKKRLLLERNKAKKEKLRVKGKQSAVQRGRHHNMNVIKEYAGWDEF